MTPPKRPGTPTPGPWRWQGEDYRGGWGWQLLVGPSGEGIIVGQDPDGPSRFLRGGMDVDPRYCVTGMAADGEPRVAAVHVREANARLIALAPTLAEAVRVLAVRLQRMLEVVDYMGYTEGRSPTVDDDVGDAKDALRLPAVVAALKGVRR